CLSSLSGGVFVFVGTFGGAVALLELLAAAAGAQIVATDLGRGAGGGRNGLRLAPRALARTGDGSVFVFVAVARRRLLELRRVLLRVLLLDGGDLLLTANLEAEHVRHDERAH